MPLWPRPRLVGTLNPPPSTFAGIERERIVGWQISTSLRSDLAIDALEMAIYSRNRNDLSNLVHHSDMGVQYLSIRYSEGLNEAQIVASVGSKGDSYDNALAESFNGLYKTTCRQLNSKPTTITPTNQKV